MSNQSQYKAMMGEVHASADLIGKVKGIPMEKTKKRTTALKFATATCAALLGVFVVTNGVCYAATGETWVGEGHGLHQRRAGGAGRADEPERRYHRGGGQLRGER